MVGTVRVGLAYPRETSRLMDRFPTGLSLTYMRIAIVSRHVSLIDYVPLVELPADIRQRKRQQIEERGNTSMLGLVLANNPEMAEARYRYNRQIRDGGNIDRRTKEICHVVVSMTNECEYCAVSHGRKLVDVEGLPEADLRAIRQGEVERFDAEVEAAARFAEQVARDQKRITDAHLEPLREVGYDDADIVELLVWISKCHASNLIVDALGVRAEDMETYLAANPLQ